MDKRVSKKKFELQPAVFYSDAQADAIGARATSTNPVFCSIYQSKCQKRKESNLINKIKNIRPFNDIHEKFSEPLSRGYINVQNPNIHNNSFFSMPDLLRMPTNSVLPTDTVSIAKSRNNFQMPAQEYIRTSSSPRDYSPTISREIYGAQYRGESQPYSRYPSPSPQGNRYLVMPSRSPSRDYSRSPNTSYRYPSTSTKYQRRRRSDTHLNYRDSSYSSSDYSDYRSSISPHYARYRSYSHGPRSYSRTTSPHSMSRSCSPSPMIYNRYSNYPQSPSRPSYMDSTPNDFHTHHHYSATFPLEVPPMRSNSAVNPGMVPFGAVKGPCGSNPSTIFNANSKIIPGMNCTPFMGPGSGPMVGGATQALPSAMAMPPVKSKKKGCSSKKQRR